MIRWRPGCAQIRMIGTAGQILTCQRALVNTFHKDDAGTRRALTSTRTARGSPNAASMMRFRSCRYLRLSKTPSTVSMQALPTGKAETAKRPVVLATASGPLGGDPDHSERVVFNWHRLQHGGRLPMPAGGKTRSRLKTVARRRLQRLPARTAAHPPRR